MLIKRKRQTPPFKVGTYILKSVSLADQKAETTPSLIQSCKLGFWSQCPLLIKDRDNPLVQSWNLGFWSQWHLLIKRQRQPLPHPTLELRFLKSMSLADQKAGNCPPPSKVETYILKSVSLADQKAETTPHPKLELLFLESVSLADQKVETTALSKVGT